MNAKVIFSKTLQGESQILNYLKEISKRENREELSILIYQGFKDLEDAPIDQYPLGEREPYIVDRELNGIKVQVELIKKLFEPKIFEMRADSQGEFHRFIYFPYIYKNELLYVFVYGFEKVSGRPDRTNFYMGQAKQLYDYLRRTRKEKIFFEE